MKRLISLFVLPALLVSMGSFAHASSAHLVLHSPPGNYLGGGGDFDIFYTPENTTPFEIQVELYNPIAGLPSYLVLAARQNQSPENDFNAFGLFFWTSDLGIPIQTGTYEALDSAPGTTNQAGLSFGFQGNGDPLPATVTITDISYYHDSTGKLKLRTFAMDFSMIGDRDPKATLTGSISYQTSVVPEPSSLVMIGIGVVVLSAVARRRRV